MHNKADRNRDDFWKTFISLRENSIILELRKYPNHNISTLSRH